MTCMIGDPTLFMRADMVEQAGASSSRCSMPGTVGKTEIPDYQSGSTAQRRPTNCSPAMDGSGLAAGSPIVGANREWPARHSSAVGRRGWHAGYPGQGADRGGAGSGRESCATPALRSRSPAAGRHAA